MVCWKIILLFYHCLFIYEYPILFRIDLAKPDQPNQIEMGRKDDSKVHKLFLDPTGKDGRTVHHHKSMVCITV